MLHARRKRLEALAAAEAAGESFWTDEFDERVRVKVLHAFRDTSRHYAGEVADTARTSILRDEGLAFLVAGRHDEYHDFIQYVLTCPDDMFPTVIEAIAIGLAPHPTYGAAADFGGIIATILREHRVSYDFVNGQMVEFSSQEMHEAVVAPTLRLLAGRHGFDGAERAYQDALEEISKGKPADAITDAGTALQETLTALGCAGNALGPLIKSARSKGLLAAHDVPLTEVIEKTLQWASADRSNTGDAHAASSAYVADAWLTVHIVGALILRLVDGGARP